jgi:hypothetical protein
MNNERIEIMNRTLTQGIDIVVQRAEDIMGAGGLSEVNRRSAEFMAGNIIRSAFLMYFNWPNIINETSIHQQLWIPVRDGSGYSLRVDDCVLYSIPSRWSRTRERWPQAPQEWYRHWRGILEGVIDASER